MVIFTGASVEEAIQNGLKTLDIPRMRAHITVISREKKGFLGLFGKKPAQVDVEPIAETTVVKANQKAVKGVPEEINAQNEPVQSVSEATVDLGRVVAAIKKVEGEGEVISDEVKAEILKNDKQANTILEETGTIDLLKTNQAIDEAVAQAEADDSKVISFEQAAKDKAEPTETEESSFADLGIQVEADYDIEEVVENVTDYVQKIVDEMDVDRLAVGPQLGHVRALNLCEHGRQVDPGLQGHAVDDVDEVRQRVSSLDGVTSTVVDGHGAVIARLGLGAGRLPIDGANELDELLGDEAHAHVQALALEAGAVGLHGKSVDVVEAPHEGLGVVAFTLSDAVVRH